MNGQLVERGLSWAIRIMLIVAVVSVGSVLLSAIGLRDGQDETWKTVAVDDLGPGQGKRVVIGGVPYLVHYLSVAQLRSIQSRPDVAPAEPRVASVAVNSGLSFGTFSVVPAVGGDPSCEVSLVKTPTDTSGSYIEACSNERYDLVGSEMRPQPADLPLPNLRVRSGELQLATPAD